MNTKSVLCSISGRKGHDKPIGSFQTVYFSIIDVFHLSFRNEQQNFFCLATKTVERQPNEFSLTSQKAVVAVCSTTPPKKDWKIKLKEYLRSIKYPIFKTYKLNILLHKIKKSFTLNRVSCVLPLTMPA